MSFYIIVEKETNIIQVMLEIDGDYFIDNDFRYSLHLSNKPVFDFSSYTYTINKETGIISKVPKVSEDIEGLVKTLEVTIE